MESSKIIASKFKDSFDAVLELSDKLVESDEDLFPFAVAIMYLFETMCETMEANGNEKFRAMIADMVRDLHRLHKDRMRSNHGKA